MRSSLGRSKPVSVRHPYPLALWTRPLPFLLATSQACSTILTTTPFDNLAGHLLHGSDTANPNAGINFSPTRRDTSRSPTSPNFSPTPAQPHHTPNDPIPEQPSYKAPPTLVAGKNGTRPTVLGEGGNREAESEFEVDADWEEMKRDGIELSKKERRKRQVEEFLAKREEGAAEGRRK